MLDRYRQATQDKPHFPIDQETLAEIEGIPQTDWDKLLNNVLDTIPGNTASTQYEHAIEALLSALFYPDLVYPKVQQKIHDGRKRIDVTYTNMAIGKFFSWLSKHYSAPHLFVECKNYTDDVGNPELDQISSRFSPSRGQVGILACRKFLNKELFLRRCRDTARDGRGYVIAIDDNDLKLLVERRKADIDFNKWSLLRERFNSLLS